MSETSTTYRYSTALQRFAVTICFVPLGSILVIASATSMSSPVGRALSAAAGLAAITFAAWFWSRSRRHRLEVGSEHVVATPIIGRTRRCRTESVAFVTDVALRARMGTAQRAWVLWTPDVEAPNFYDRRHAEGSLTEAQRSRIHDGSNGQRRAEPFVIPLNGLSAEAIDHLRSVLEQSGGRG
ncbi:hypothetical protein [Ilumatobacter nonamiensis]|uniref:hypothetical protein n=1 Tax=Ilumatobacter nonamiensis TaxID=467093 RepID=UPI00034D027B|nr:hypothetical protein [Ilumatobacter nonamiensis]